MRTYKIKLCGREWTIQIVRQVCDPHTGEFNDNDAECFKLHSLIQVRRDMDPGAMIQRIAHELVHALIEASGYEIPNSEEERLAEVLSGPLASLLTDNGRFVGKCIGGTLTK